MMKTNRYVCVHGHFYQPPRENPWIEAIEIQDTARPYHDWNARITAECYGPNGASRILDQEGFITRIVNNYGGMSFNFGPTLLSWLESHAPDVYQSILEGDKLSQERFSGHGSAMAQVYNHIIMPLANRRDKETQILWGIADFRHRFGRLPAGMWLAETAVDLETLDLMALHGLRFTILSPTQARGVRPIGTGDWNDVSGGSINPRQPYLVRLASGRDIAVFFYDAPISQAVAFEKLLDNGEHFAWRMIDALPQDTQTPQLVHVATDGETYGHHHFKGDMALAYALHTIESSDAATLTNYAEFLDRYPPTVEVDIIENTAWSCPHGLGRWREHCGCNSGTPGFTQHWRKPLRETFDRLRDTLADRFDTEGTRLLVDPWAARNDYIDVILDRSETTLSRFLDKHAARQLDDTERVEVIKMLESQRHAMLMYTSCGWFFDDISGIETVQVMQYAVRAIQLAADVFNVPDLEAQLREGLRGAKSNLPEFDNGEGVFLKRVKPAIVDLSKVAAHYALSSLFRDYPESTDVYAYTVTRDKGQTFTSGRNRMATGCVSVQSHLTLETSTHAYAAVGLGDHNLVAGVSEKPDVETCRKLFRAFQEAAEKADSVEAIQVVTRSFPTTYTIRSLFRDEQRQILRQVLDTALAEDASAYRRLYDQHEALMRFVHDLGSPLPLPLYIAARYVLNEDLLEALHSEPPRVDRARELIDLARRWQVKLDATHVRYAIQETVEGLTKRFMDSPRALQPLSLLDGMLRLARSMPFDINLWKTQNAFCAFLKERLPLTGDDTSRHGGQWQATLASVGKLLEVRVPAEKVPH